MPSPLWRRRALAAAVAALVVVVALLGPLAAPAAAEPGVYLPPVDRPLVDRFRPPPTRYGSGNRGVDYATEPGEPVRAAADGEVTFAGRVGLGLHVVVLHPDGIRTSYSFLAGVLVRRGDRVARGDPLGTAGASLHWGARVGDTYVDPLGLLVTGPPEVHLVPTDLRAAGTVAEERAGLLAGLTPGRAVALAWSAAGRAAAAGGRAVAWAGDAAAAQRRLALVVADRAARVTWAQLEADLRRLPVVEAATVLERARRFRVDQAGCTPADEPVPPPPRHRRIVVLVGGYGSASGRASVLELDTAALGYHPADVVQFSYAGGRAPGTGALAGVPVRAYGPADAGQHLQRSADRLRELLDDIDRAHPGIPVDVVAHSQGGVVARAALAGRPRPLSVEHLVTLGSPHDGTDLATANAGLGARPAGRAGRSVVAWASDGGLDGAATSAAQLAEGSAFLGALADRGFADGLRVISVAADGDLVVPALHSSLPGATNVLVPLGGTDAHTRLSGDPATTREVALALAGRGPTCRDVGPGLVRAAFTSWAEDQVGAGLVGAAAALGPGP
jgi:murein DD-endopeptidase MepM/ murein hydrolase activator NlpD